MDKKILEVLGFFNTTFHHDVEVILGKEGSSNPHLARLQDLLINKDSSPSLLFEYGLENLPNDTDFYLAYPLSTYFLFLSELRGIGLTASNFAMDAMLYCEETPDYRSTRSTYPKGDVSLREYYRLKIRHILPA